MTFENPRLHAGQIHEHPEDGPIRILSGAWMINGLLSNHWKWEVLESGETKSGYGGTWENISDQYVTVAIPKSVAGERSRAQIIERLAQSNPASTDAGLPDEGAECEKAATELGED